MIVEKSFQTESGTLNYAEGSNSGPPLVLLHGITADWNSFMPLFATLSQRWHIYAPDFRGHGKSSSVPGQYRLVDYAEDITQFIRSTFDKPPAIFGHSLGGMVGILVAAHHPELARALIVGDSLLYKETLSEFQPNSIEEQQNIIRSISSVDEMAEAISTREPTQSGAWHRYVANSYTNLDADILELFCDFGEEYDCASLFPKIICPVLLLQSALLTDEDVEKAIAQLSKGYFAKFDGMGHELHLEPGGYQVVTEICLFLESLR
ncbi:MAG: alpha/beta fold hydrolase [Candidatus Latescibacteria bacterium]|nr:alpha/beta fold hydrolase [Candidatus Latescibacterota bacterium]